MTKEKLEKAVKLLRWIEILENDKKTVANIASAMEENPKLGPFSIPVNTSLGTKKAILKLIFEDLTGQLEEPLKGLEEL